MITTTTAFRRGLLRVSKCRIIPTESSKVKVNCSLLSSSSSSSSVVALFSTAPQQQQQKRICPFSDPNLYHHLSSSNQLRPFGLATDVLIHRFQHGCYHSYHSSPQSQLQSSGAAVVNKVEESDRSTTASQQGFLSESIRSIILQDLHSVDTDNNGKISADELMALLRKHKDTFTESEILELGELFYTSLGASSVDFDQFMIAIDAALASKALSASDKDDAIAPLAAKGKFRTHPLGIGTCASEYMFAKTHGKYTEAELNIQLKHLEPITFLDKSALFAVKCVRFVFDAATLWNVGDITKSKILNRAIFLETIAAIPGMVAAIIRHFRSLRNMSRDGGMLNMFLEEANNERMHLLTFIKMKKPGYTFRAAVIASQFGFGSFFLAAYMINPAWCHRFVGYVEEEACHTYTKILKEMDSAEVGSELAMWKSEPAPKIAIGYWHLGEHGTVYDVMQAVRADEAEHRDVNHAVSGVPADAVNPLFDPRDKLDLMLKKYVSDIMRKGSADKDVSMT